MILHDKENITVAILGCGRIAGIKDSPKSMGSITTHAQAFHRHKGFKIIAACDNNPVKLNIFQSKWKIPKVYDDVRKMISETNPNVISICTATNSHFTNLCTILESSEPPQIIFVEKPICQTKEELEELKRLLSSTNTKIIVNHSRRYEPTHNEIAQNIKTKKWGNLIDGYCFYYGGWMNNGTHIIDTLRMFFGNQLEIKGVEAGYDSGREDDPCYNCLLKYESSTIHVRSFPEKYYQLFEFDLRFEKGRLLIKDFGEQIYFEKQRINHLGESVLENDKEYPIKGFNNPIFYAVDSIYNYLITMTDIPFQIGTTIEDAEETMKLIWDISSIGKSNNYN